MHFRSLLQASVLVGTACLMGWPAGAQEGGELWRLGEFAAPESVSYDPGTGTLFVSNLAVDLAAPRGEGPAAEAPSQAGAPAAPPPAPEEPKGYITQLSLDGTVLNERFLEGLAAPGGNAIVDGTLWQMAGDLLKIDIASATILETFPRPADAQGLLPDVAIAPDGRAFVTAMSGAIYVTENGALVPWLQDPSLERANGIVIDGSTMYVAAGTAIKVVDLETQEISDFGPGATLEGLDDLRMIPTGMLVSSGGRVVEVTPDGTVTPRAAADGVAGLAYVADRNMVVVTRLRGGEVIANEVKF